MWNPEHLRIARLRPAHRPDVQKTIFASSQLSRQIRSRFNFLSSHEPPQPRPQGLIPLSPQLFDFAI